MTPEECRLLDLPSLPASWRWHRLGDLVDHTRGICYGIVQPGKHDPAGVPMINSQDVMDGWVAPRINFRVARALHEGFRRSTIKGGEVLLTLVGANFGRAAMAPESFAGFNCSRAVGVLPVMENAPFVMMCLRSPVTRRFLNAWANTTAQPTFNLKDVANLPIPGPPPDEQRAIVQVLLPIDEKIELNRRMNDTLDSIARALFKSWFVDLDPVHAKIAGRPLVGVDSVAAALFPDSIDADVPRGWTSAPLDSIAHFQNGLPLQNYPAMPTEPSLPVIKIAEIRAGTSDGADRANLTVPASHRIDDGDLVFSWSGSLLVRLWAGGPGALNQHLFKVTSLRYPRWFIRGWLLQYLPEFQAIAAAKATTMGHIQRHHLSDAKVTIPTGEVLDCAGRLLGSLEERTLRNDIENRTLSALRDLLLPRLLSGDLRIRDAEREVERVA